MRKTTHSHEKAVPCVKLLTASHRLNTSRYVVMLKMTRGNCSDIRLSTHPLPTNRFFSVSIKANRTNLMLKIRNIYNKNPNCKMLWFGWLVILIWDTVLKQNYIVLQRGMNVSHVLMHS